MNTVIVPLLLFLFSWNKSEPATFTDPRDGETYPLVEIENLIWFKENLRYRTESGNDTLLVTEECGVFYLQHDAERVCPEGWRLPTEKEVKALIKADKKGKLHLSDTLDIVLCGRIDYEKLTKTGDQNTFWLQAELQDGHVVHWHTFGKEHTLHSHDVINARRKFPVRCVCELKADQP